MQVHLLGADDFPYKTTSFHLHDHSPIERDDLLLTRDSTNTNSDNDADSLKSVIKGFGPSALTRL